MFPDIKDIPVTAAEFDAWAGKLTTEQLTPKFWYIVGASHRAPSASLYSQLELQGLALLFDSFYPVAIGVAKDNTAGMATGTLQ